MIPNTGGDTLFCYDNHLIIDEVQHGETRFCRAEDSGTGQQLYFMAEPEVLRPLPGHSGLQVFRMAGTAEGLRWNVGEIPTGPSLRDAWMAEELSSDDLATCLLQVVETLAHLASTRPALLPDEVTPDHVRRLDTGSWVLDLAGLALTSGIRLGSGGSVIKALGNMLRQLLGDETSSTPVKATPPSRQSSPAVRFIMMRCLWGGFASLDEVRQALTQLSTRESEDASNGPAVAPPAEEAVIRRHESERPAPVDMPVPTGRPPTNRTGLVRGLVASAVLVGVVTITGLAVRTTTQSSEAPQVAPEVAPPPAVPASPAVVRAQVDEPAPSTPTTLPPNPEPAFNDVLSETDLPRFAPKPEPAAPPPPTPKPTPKPSRPVQPVDPVAAADKATAGDNLVTVRLYGHVLGQVYMFTNPGAPVISLDSLSRILKRPVNGELTRAGNLRVVDGSRSFDTGSFVVLNERVWLILAPELTPKLGIRVVSYGNGILDLEPQSR